MHPDFEKFAQIQAQQAQEEADLQAQAGQLTPRQRLAALFDQGEFQELFRYTQAKDQSSWQDGLVCAYGNVNGRPIVAYATEYQNQGGSVGVRQSRQMVEVYRLARQSGIPIVALLESSGARIHEGLHIMESYAAAMRESVFCSGMVPQIACVFGYCIGASAIMATLCDFIVIEEQGTISLAGARINQSATGEKLTEHELGGVNVHTEHTGYVHAVCQGDRKVLQHTRELLAWLPANHSESPPQFETDDPINRLAPQAADRIPIEANAPFHIQSLIQDFTDEQAFFEVQEEHAPNLVTGFAAFGGQSVAIVANQSQYLSGAMDANATRKLARFLTLVANFNYPLITFLDVPGAMPTLAAQQDRIIGALNQAMHAQCLIHALKITVVVRRCFGGTYAMMHPKNGEGDLIFAYPNAMIGVMSAQAQELVMMKMGKKPPESALRLDDPLLAAEHLYIDDIIQPEQTRQALIRALKTFGNKRIHHYPSKRSGNPPL